MGMEQSYYFFSLKTQYLKMIPLITFHFCYKSNHPKHSYLKDNFKKDKYLYLLTICQAVHLVWVSLAELGLSWWPHSYVWLLALWQVRKKMTWPCVPLIQQVSLVSFTSRDYRASKTNAHFASLCLCYTCYGSINQSESHGQAKSRSEMLKDMKRERKLLQSFLQIIPHNY